MTNRRKQIRVTLPADKVQAFMKAKVKAEGAAMIKLTDTQFASRLVQWAIEYQETMNKEQSTDPDQ